MIVVRWVRRKDAHPVAHEVEEAEHGAARLELLEGTRVEIVELARGKGATALRAVGTALEGVVKLEVVAPGEEGVGGLCRVRGALRPASTGWRVKRSSYSRLRKT